MRTLLPIGLIAVLSLIVGCGPPPTPSSGSPGDRRISDAAVKKASPKTPDPPPIVRAHPLTRADLVPRRYRVTVTAVFEALPKGARILAPAPRDRHYQKVTKSDHAGTPGAVFASTGGENLVFLSEPLKTPTVTYRGVTDVELRYMMPGYLEGLDALPYGTFRYPREAAFAKAFATQHGAPPAAPFPLVMRAFDEAVAGSKSAPHEVAISFAQALQKARIPHRMVQGLRLDEKGSATPHAWVDVLLPRLGWAPFDPLAHRASGGRDGAFKGRHPPDRIRTIFGAGISLETDEGKSTFTYAGPLGGPVAVKGSARVGKVKLSVKVAPLPIDKPR